MNKKIKEVNLNGKRIFLRKGLFKGEYKVVYPNKIDGKINWKNLLIGGSYSNLITIILIVLMISAISYSYYHDQKEFRDLVSDPCKYMIIAQQRCDLLNNIQKNPLSGFNLSFNVSGGGENGG